MSRHNKISRIEFRGFAGFVNYDMDLANPVTIITAPNGCGKTTLFHMISFVMDPSGQTFERIRDLPFDEFRCCLANGMAVGLKREDRPGTEEPDFIYTIYNKDGSVRNEVDYLKEYGECAMWCVGNVEKKYLEDAGCGVSVNFRPPSHTYYVNYVTDGRYTWETNEEKWENADNPPQFELFTRYFNERNECTGKEVRVGPEGVTLYSKQGQITIDTMSVGELHDFALFYNLIFNVSDGVVLIDEPERSMHIALQNTFIDKVMEICRMNDLQVIIATHSPDIVNGYSELMRWPEFAEH